jgi:hypothetical protein
MRTGFMTGTCGGTRNNNNSVVVATKRRRRTEVGGERVSAGACNNGTAVIDFHI